MHWWGYLWAAAGSSQTQPESNYQTQVKNVFSCPMGQVREPSNRVHKNAPK